MAGYAVVEPENTLLIMFLPKFTFGMFVASVAGIGGQVVIGVANTALYIMVAIKVEIARMVECRGHPLRRGMAAAAILLN